MSLWCIEHVPKLCDVVDILYGGKGASLMGGAAGTYWLVDRKRDLGAHEGHCPPSNAQHWKSQRWVHLANLIDNMLAATCLSSCHFSTNTRKTCTT
eukprot:1593874-Amphidinium_carterae.1